MNLKEFLSDPTLQKDENGNILCRKIKNSKLHHMKPQFCMSPRLHSEGWEIVRKLEPPPVIHVTNPLTNELKDHYNNPDAHAHFTEAFGMPNAGMDTSNMQEAVEVKPKRKTKRKTTTKRKRTVKTLTPETNNG